MTKIETIVSDYFTISVYDDGKHVEIDLADGVKIQRHHKQLRAYVEKLWQSGIKKMNADQISLPYLDKGIGLVRGNRRLDLIYYKDGRIYECEFKTRRECGLDITYSQIQEQLKYCENFILLVPSSEIPWVEDQIRNRKIKGVTVDRHD